MSAYIYSINDLESLSGIRTHTIRMWERRYAALTPLRTNSNIRLYTREDLKRVVQISFLLDCGYRIGKIASLNVEDFNELFGRELKLYPYPSIDLVQMLVFIMDMNIDGLEAYLELRLSELAPEEFIVNILEPLSERLKLLSLLATTSRATEEYFMNRMFLKIIQVSDRLSSPIRNPREVFIFQSDKGIIPVKLSLVYLLAIIKNYKVNFLVYPISVDMLLDMKSEIQADIVYTEFNESISEAKVLKYVHAMEKAFPTAKNIVSGNQMKKYWKIIPNKVHYIRSLEVLNKLL